MRVALVTLRSDQEAKAIKRLCQMKAKTADELSSVMKDRLNLR
jgi:hypothetical protein